MLHTGRFDHVLKVTRRARYVRLAYSCDFERWAHQALGLVGIVLGETEFLHWQIRGAATTKLDKFIAEHPDRV